MTRAIHRAISSSSSWEDYLLLNDDVFQEFDFWLLNIDPLNNKPFIPKSSTIGVVFFGRQQNRIWRSVLS